MRQLENSQNVCGKKKRKWSHLFYRKKKPIKTHVSKSTWTNKIFNLVRYQKKKSSGFTIIWAIFNRSTIASDPWFDL